MKQRRPFQALLILAVACVLHGEQNPKKFRVWVFSDAHVGSDLRDSDRLRSDAAVKGPDGRESLVTAIRQSEDSRAGFLWDIALDLATYRVRKAHRRMKRVMRSSVS